MTALSGPQGPAGRPMEGRQVEGRRVATGQGGGADFTYTVTLVAAAPPADRRDTRRMRSRLQEGQIAERGRPVVGCRIRDRSRGGARLLLDEARPLPARFLLTDAASRGRFWATLAWQNGRDAGVRLVPV